MTIICDANKLPEEIKSKAHEYIEQRILRFKTAGIVSEDVECAWLNGFAFCLEGTVEVKVKQCSTCVYTDSPCTPSDYAKDTKDVCGHYKNVFEENVELKKENKNLKKTYRKQRNKRIDALQKKKAELIKENKVLAQNLEDTEILNKTYEKRFDDLEKENAELKGEAASVLDNWCKGDDPCLHLKKRDEQLTKAKELIKGLLPMASNFVFGTLPKLDEEVQLYKQAEQFLKDCEVEK